MSERELLTKEGLYDDDLHFDEMSINDKNVVGDPDRPFSFYLLATINFWIAKECSKQKTRWRKKKKTFLGYCNKFFKDCKKGLLLELHVWHN